MEFTNSILSPLVLKTVTIIGCTTADSKCDAVLKEVLASLAASYHETGKTVSWANPRRMCQNCRYYW